MHKETRRSCQTGKEKVMLRGLPRKEIPPKVGFQGVSELNQYPEFTYLSPFNFLPGHPIDQTQLETERRMSITVFYEGQPLKTRGSRFGGGDRTIYSRVLNNPNKLIGILFINFESRKMSTPVHHFNPSYVIPIPTNYLIHPPVEGVQVLGIFNKALVKMHKARKE